MADGALDVAQSMQLNTAQQSTTQTEHTLRQPWRTLHGADLALDLGARHKRRHGIDDDDVHRAGAHQLVHHLLLQRH